MKTIPVLILAGNYYQFKNFLLQHGLNPRDYRYIQSREQLAGFRDFNFIKIGTWYKNSAYDNQFFDEISIRQGKQGDEEDTKNDPKES